MIRNRGLIAAGAVLLTAAGISVTAGTAQGVVPRTAAVQLGATGTGHTANVEDKMYVPGAAPILDSTGQPLNALDALKLGQRAEITVTQDGSSPTRKHEALLYVLGPNETKAEALAKIKERADASTNFRLDDGSGMFTRVPVEAPGNTVTLDPGTDYILLCNIVPHFRLGMYTTLNENGNHNGHDGH